MERWTLTTASATATELEMLLWLLIGISVPESPSCGLLSGPHFLWNAEKFPLPKLLWPRSPAWDGVQMKNSEREWEAHCHTPQEFWQTGMSGTNVPFLSPDLCPSVQGLLGPKPTFFPLPRFSTLLLLLLFWGQLRFKWMLLLKLWIHFSGSP